MFLKKSAEKKF